MKPRHICIEPECVICGHGTDWAKQYAELDAKYEHLQSQMTQERARREAAEKEVERLKSQPWIEGSQLEDRIGALEQENSSLQAHAKILREALEVTRGQWIHSVNADQCLQALATTPEKLQAIARAEKRLGRSVNNLLEVFAEFPDDPKVWPEAIENLQNTFAAYEKARGYEDKHQSQVQD